MRRDLRQGVATGVRSQMRATLSSWPVSALRENGIRQVLLRQATGAATPLQRQELELRNRMQHQVRLLLSRLQECLSYRRVSTLHGDDAAKMSLREQSEGRQLLRGCMDL